MFQLNKIEDLTEKVIKYILPIIFFLPFCINSHFYFPFITPRNFAFRILITIVLALYLFLLFRNKNKYQPIKNNVLMAYVIFAILLTLASILGGDFLYSFWSNYERMEGLLGSYYLIALLIVILGIYKKKRDWLILFRISIWSSFLMSILALSQSWGINLFIESSGGDRISGTLGNPTYLAVYSLFNFFFAIYLFAKHKIEKPVLELWFFCVVDIVLFIAYVLGKIPIDPAEELVVQGLVSKTILYLVLIFIIPQIFIVSQYYLNNFKSRIKYSWFAYLFFIILLNFISLFNTQTRGVLVGVFVASIFVAIFLLFSKHVKRLVKYYIFSILIIILVFIGMLFSFNNSDFVQNNNTLRRISNISFSDVTTETRLLTWQASLQGFKEKPVLGWGEEKFYVVFNKYFPNQIYKDSGSRVWFDRPHNVFLQQLINGGILGLLAYLSIFFFAFKNLWKHYRNTNNYKTMSILGGLLVAYLVQNFFVFDSLNSYIPMIILLAVTVFVSGDLKPKDNVDSKSNNSMAFIASLLILIIGLYLNIPQALANMRFMKEYNKLQSSIGQEYQKDKLNSLVTTINSRYLGKFELRQVLSELVSSLIRVRVLQSNDMKYFIDISEKEMLLSIEEQPDNVRNHSFLLNLYLYTAGLDPDYAFKGVNLINNKAIALSPTRVQLYYSLGQFYMNLDQSNMAIDSFNQAKELAPNVFDSYYNLFITYLNLGDLEMAKVEISNMEDNVSYMSLDNYLRIFKAYEYFKYSEEAEEIENKVLKYENNL